MKYLSFILFISTIILFGCTKGYTIVCESNNEAWGTATGGGKYSKGDVAILTATPVSGYFFLGWQDGDVLNPRAVKVSGNATYRALFGDTPFGVFNGEPFHVSGKICNDQVWPDLGLDVDYIIDGNLSIGCNATVRVMPNVTIMFSDANGKIEVVENGALNMVGTERFPIVLRGSDINPNPGSWGQVMVNSNRNENSFLYVEFRGGGSRDDLHGGVVNVRGKLSMMCCVIDGSLGSGLVTEEGSELTTFAYNTIQNCAGYPWVTSDFPSLCKGDIVGNNLLYQNSSNSSYFVYIDLDYYSVNESMVLPNIMPTWYYFPHGFYFDGNGSLVFDESQVLVGGGKQLRVGKNLHFKAIANTVYVMFSSFFVNEPWGGMVFESECADNKLQWCWFKYCGTNNGYCLKVTENAKLSLSNCNLGPCGRYGIWIENIGTWGNVTHSNINTHSCPKLAHIEHGGTFHGLTYADNTDLDILPK